MTYHPAPTPLCACGQPVYRLPGRRPFARCLACIKIKPKRASAEEQRRARLEAVLARHRGEVRR